jgi:hypothetical protein
MSASALLPQARKFKSAPVQIHARRNTDDMDHQLRHISPIVVNNPLTFFKKLRKFAKSRSYGGARHNCGEIAAETRGQIFAGKAALVQYPTLPIRKACIAPARSCQSGSRQCQYAQNEKNTLVYLVSLKALSYLPLRKGARGAQRHSVWRMSQLKRYRSAARARFQSRLNLRLAALDCNTGET